ncbi:hypothetical protein [Streptosporangium sandarakinum]
MVPEPAEYAVPSPERADRLRTQIAHRLGFGAAPVCTYEIDTREAGTMREPIFGMNVTLDGYIAATGDDLGWSGGEGPDTLRRPVDDGVSVTEAARTLKIGHSAAYATLAQCWPVAISPRGPFLPYSGGIRIR